MDKELENLAKTDPRGRPLTGPSWGDVRRSITWSTPVLPTGASPSSYIEDCPCEECRRRRSITPGEMVSQLEAQGLRIKKLEELVKMLTRALGVNEEFLSEAYKGTV